MHKQASNIKTKGAEVGCEALVSSHSNSYWPARNHCREQSQGECHWPHATPRHTTPRHITCNTSTAFLSRSPRPRYVHYNYLIWSRFTLAFTTFLCSLQSNSTIYTYHDRHISVSYPCNLSWNAITTYATFPVRSRYYLGLPDHTFHTIAAFMPHLSFTLL